ncbi:hypothetical protein BVG79_01249 [Ketogulonicigenium robustum]|uniref:Uncharacterized protein n=1 Tax=Ketogulonicigenium robustum TaxID=92947 RepID=A0A1W6NZC2_9RHOB|nr:hypothetical protein BVG79_01249 [Ketogulonicigenium robustum]
MGPRTMVGSYNTSVLTAIYENLVALEQDLNQNPALAIE